jgi:hypothetical protein
MSFETDMIMVQLSSPIPGDENCARMSLKRPSTRIAAGQYARQAWDLIATLDDAAQRFAWDYQLPFLLARSMLVEYIREIYTREGLK